MAIFMTDVERKAAQKKRRRKALREAENAIDLVKDRCASLKAERDAKWSEAREYVKCGQKAAAQRALNVVRVDDVLLIQLDQKRWVFENIITKMESAETDVSFAEALGTLLKVNTVDPDRIAEVLDEAAGKSAELAEVNKVWNKEYGKQMNGIAASEAVPAIDEMLAEVTKEAATEIQDGNGGGSKKTTEDMRERLKAEFAKGL